MYNSSGLIGNNNRDIFKMREMMINNMIMKNNIDTNRYRQKNDRYSLLKDHKIFHLKKPSSPKQPLSKPIKTFLPINTPVSKSIVSYGNMPTSPSVLVRPSSINASRSVLSTNVKPVLDTEEKEKSYKSHQGYKNHYLDMKRRNSLNKGVKIEMQNEKFGNKLKRVSSPLNKDRLNSSYSKLQEYGNIAKKVETDFECNKRKIKNIRNYLPPLFAKNPAQVNISKTDHMLAMGKINNFRKFGS